MGKEIRDSRRGGGASVPFGAANRWILKGRWGGGIVVPGR